MKLKKLLITSLAAGLFALSACGNTATTQKSDSKEINKSEILSKMVEVDRAYKSAEVVMKNTMNINTSEQKVVFDVNADMQIALEPLQAYVSMEVQSPETKDALKVNTYIKDGFSYVNTELTPQLKDVWVKTVYDEKQFGAVINRANSSDYTQFFKSVEKDIKIYENDKQYLIKEDIKQEDINKLIAKKQAETPIPSFSLFKLKQINTKSYFDKETFNINKVKVNVETEYIGNVKIEVEIDFTNQNEIKEITLPKEALEAKTIPTEGN